MGLVDLGVGDVVRVGVVEDLGVVVLGVEAQEVVDRGVEGLEGVGVVVVVRGEEGFVSGNMPGDEVYVALEFWVRCLVVRSHFTSRLQVQSIANMTVISAASEAIQKQSTSPSPHQRYSFNYPT
jgi:hypothetical protein